MTKEQLFPMPERKYLSEFSKYGFLSDKNLQECFAKLSLEFFPFTKPYMGGFLDRETENASIFIGNMSRDAMIMLYDDCTFNYNNNHLPKHISLHKKNLNIINDEFNKYSIRKNLEQRQGIYFFNHSKKMEASIIFSPQLEVTKSKELSFDERKIKSYILDSQNSLEKLINILKDSI